MPYLLPETAELVRIINELRPAYKNSKPIRNSMIALLEQIVAQLHTIPENKRRDVLLGGLVFALADIAEEYKPTLFCPIQFSPEKSTLFKMISAKLNLSEKNTLNDDERFMYLGQFYLYLANENTNINTSGLYWRSKAALLTHVESNLLKLKDKEKVRLEALQTAQPTLEALEKELDECCILYAAECNSRTCSPTQSRLELVKFVEFVREAARIDFPKEDALNNEDRYLRAVYIRLGLIMYVLLEINSEYNYFNPAGNAYLGNYNGSSLFKLCQKALNIKSLTDLTCKQKMPWLDQLHVYMEEVICDPKKYETIPYKLKLDPHIAKLRHVYSKEDAIHNPRSLSLQAAEKTATTIVSYSLSAMFAQFIGTTLAGSVSFTTLASLGIGTVTSIGLASGSAGLLALGGTVIVTRYVGGWALSYVMEKISQKTCEATTHLIQRAFSDDKPDDYYYLDKHPKIEAEEKIFIDKWIDTVLLLPDSIIKLEEKNQIRAILGMNIQNNVKFIPHSDLVPVFSAKR